MQQWVTGQRAAAAGEVEVVSIVYKRGDPACPPLPLCQERRPANKTFTTHRARTGVWMQEEKGRVGRVHRRKEGEEETQEARTCGRSRGVCVKS